MKSILVVAVGLLIGAALMVAGGQPFFEWWMHNSPLHTWILAVTVLNQTEAYAAGLPLVGVLTFATLCVGAGLLISSLLSVLIEVIGLALGGLSAVAAIVAIELIRWMVRRVRHARLVRRARRAL